MAFVTVRSVERSWIRIFLNSVSNAENTFVLISRGKKTPVQNLTPVILGIIIVLLVWMICFFVRVVVTTGQERDASHLRIISVVNAKKYAKRLALWSRLDATPQGA
jgi:hypothetical protein